MNAWRCFLDSLSTDGGHIFVLLALIVAGVCVFVFDATAGGQIMTGALGALYMMLRSSGTNRDQIAKTPLATDPAPVAPTPPATVE